MNERGKKDGIKITNQESMMRAEQGGVVQCRAVCIVQWYTGEAIGNGMAHLAAIVNSDSKMSIRSSSSSS